MTFAARCILLLLGSVLMCHYIPQFYASATRSPVRTPYFYYSSVEQKLLVGRQVDGERVYMDLAGKVYSRDAFEQATPLSHHAQLVRDGRMPATIGGVKVNQQLILSERSYLRIRPQHFAGGLVNLRPLFEAASGRVNLEMPSDLMELGARVRFLRPADNSEDSFKGVWFTDRMEAAGVTFPVVRYGSNPTTRKPFDEGFILQDAADRLWRLRMAGGEPEVTPLAALGLAGQSAAWATLRPRLIEVQEQANRYIRALIVDEAETVWLLAGDPIRLVPLRLRSYRAADSRLLLRGNLLYTTVLVRAPETIEVLVLDRDHTVVASHMEAIPQRSDLGYRIGRMAFPLSIDVRSATSPTLQMSATWGSPLAFLFSALLAGGYLGWAALSRRLQVSRLMDALAIALTGICGLVLVLVLPSFSCSERHGRSRPASAIPARPASGRPE